MIGPVLEVHIVHLHGKHGLQNKIPSPNDPNRTSQVFDELRKESIRERVAYPNPGHNLTSSELLEERQEIDPCSLEQ